MTGPVEGIEVVELGVWVAAHGALNAFKMAVICLIGAMLFDDGFSDDLKLVVAASGTHLLTQLGLADLGITEEIESGPIAIREERIAEVQSRVPAAH